MYINCYKQTCLLVVVLGLCSCTALTPPAHRRSDVSALQQELAAMQAEKSGDNATVEAEAATENSQGLIDSAMEFFQVSNDFWEQGDLENALDALDKSYSLILAVGEDAGQDQLQQKEDLRITIARRIMEVYASRFNAVNGHQHAIPLVMNRHVEKALKSFQGREKRFFTESYIRSGRYRPAILKALREEGLPEELSWLPLIESGFKIRALSKARALGMWQFIASTGYKFGLHRDAWIDERMDPEKSTVAAIAYLKELHGIFGDWTTALAAYNCGEGRVLKVIKRQKVSYLDNFWDLYTKLPYETASYVPRFLAVLHIINAPEQYGFELPPVAAEVAQEDVTINKQVHVKTLARNIDMSYKELKVLNPELRKNVTPDQSYVLSVPAGKAETLLAKLDNIPIYVPPVPPYVVHRVRNGESLSVIANKYKTSVRAIVARNNLKSRSMIRVGWKLKIPTSRRTYRKSRPAITTTRMKGNLREYVVRKGDSLWEIANRFKTTTKTIQTLNNLRSTRLAVGQVLLLPKEITTASAGSLVDYLVQNGDSPYIIAKRYRMNLADFLRINNLTPRSMIFPGQNLTVRVD